MRTIGRWRGTTTEIASPASASMTDAPDGTDPVRAADDASGVSSD
jgi:hypothetical protein